MISDEQYKDISEEVYEVDSQKTSKPWKKGNIIEKTTKNYKILKTEDNQENGMQAMAIAPIVNGKPDTSQIVIAYAGITIWNNN